jgi:putative nucleotidyltransferase with HDIG domain
MSEMIRTPENDLILDQQKIRENLKQDALKRCYFRQCRIIEQDENILDRLLDIKLQDEKTYDHTLAVANISAYLINRLGPELSDTEAEFLMRSSLLHDYGKIATDPELLNKSGALEPEEKQEINKHAAAGYEMLDDENESIRTIVGSHHLFQKNAYGIDINKILNDKEAMKITKIIAAVDSFQSMIDEYRVSNEKGILPIQRIVKELNDRFTNDRENEIVLKSIMMLEEFYYENIEKSPRLLKYMDQESAGHA